MNSCEKLNSEMKMSILGSLVLAAFGAWLAVADPQVVYLKYVKCNFSTTYAYENYSCFAKSYNRSYSAGTVLATSRLPINTFNLELVFQFKYGMIYREVLRVKQFEWCDAMRKISERNVLTRFFVDMLEESVPGMIHPCPYTEIKIDKISVKTSSVASAFPTGDYKIIFFLSDADKNFIGTIFVVASVNSTNKDTFG